MSVPYDVALVEGDFRGVMSPSPLKKPLGSRENSSRDPNRPSSFDDKCHFLEVPKAKIDEDISNFDDLSSGSKRLSRGISRATDNVTLVSRARSELTQGLWGDSPSPPLDTPVYTFTLPDFSIYPTDFRNFLEKDLIETSTLTSLEAAGRLNWWAKKEACQRLWPLATTGDGNCLLHAASLGMWGFHDRLLTLRKALHLLIQQNELGAAFYRRWRWQTARQHREAGLVLTELEWEQEWEGVLRMASSDPRPLHGSSSTSTGGPATGGRRGADVYESLEEIHVLALAHVLRRPILVIADTVLKDATGQPFAPIPFGGVYLPLEVPPSECHRSPLCLTYDAAHFSALVPMDNEMYADKAPHLPAAIPLVDPDHKLLPIQFAVDPGKEVHWGLDEIGDSSLVLTDRDKLGLLQEYLDVIDLPLQEKFWHILPPLPLGNTPIEDSPPHSMPQSLEQIPPKNHGKLHSFAKHFGSIGRSMSKKIKRNLGGIMAKRSNSFKVKASSTADIKHDDNTIICKNKSATLATTHSLASKDQTSLSIPQVTRQRQQSSAFIYKPSVLIAAMLHTEKRHEYQQDMIKNYLNSARSRFLREKEAKNKAASIEAAVAKATTTAQCISPGCTMFGSPSTSYLCSACYTKQKRQEAEIESSTMLANSTAGKTEGSAMSCLSPEKCEGEKLDLQK